jgi:hypothetical protein
LWLKRLRKARGNKIRFFASGEYGTKQHRPHYHAILFGIAETESDLIDKTWGQGRTEISKLTPRRIAYAAGYTQKKLNDREREKQEELDPETGEIYKWQQPFIVMSRRPGIGGHARQHTQSWRNYAIHNGQQIAVPRFYKKAWEQKATAAEIQDKKDQDAAYRQTQQHITLEHIAARHKINEAKQKIADDKRTRTEARGT